MANVVGNNLRIELPRIAIAAGVAPGSKGVRKMATARYIDRFEARRGEWRGAHHTPVFSAIQDKPLDATVAFPPDFVEERHGMDDFLYKARATMA